MYVVGVRAKGEVRYRIVCRTYSLAYANRVARRWQQKGYDVVIDEEQQEDAAD